MGMIIIGAFFLALICAGAVGVVSLIIFMYAQRKGRGSTKLYLLIAGGVTVLVGGAALAWMFGGPPSTGAPSGYDYDRAIHGAALLGTAPGCGLLAGLLALFKKSAPAPAARA
ncbi:hypothetical protein ACLESO_06855 [Pyxidicoccus sp. 3LG]